MERRGCAADGDDAVLAIVGDVVSNGAISNAGTMQVAGDTYARCQASVSGLVEQCYPSGNSAPCTYPDKLGVVRTGYTYADPNYAPPVVVGGAQAKPGSAVIIAPGTFAADPAFAAGTCYFLAGGVYRWNAGYTNNNAFVSNELKPPAEPRVGDNTKLAQHPFWDADNVEQAMERTVWW